MLHIIQEQNTEVLRRIIIEKYGLAKYTHSWYVDEVDSDQYGTLYNGYLATVPFNLDFHLSILQQPPRNTYNIHNKENALKHKQAGLFHHPSCYSPGDR